MGSSFGRKRKTFAAPEAKLFPVVPKNGWRAANQTGPDGGDRDSTSILWDDVPR